MNSSKSPSLILLNKIRVKRRFPLRFESVLSHKEVLPLLDVVHIGFELLGRGDNK